MSRFRMLGIAAISWLPLFSMVTSAQAQIPFTSNVASDWLSTFPTTAAMAASTHATWGNAANTGGTTIWSAGNLSYNWTNVESSVYPTTGAWGVITGSGTNWEYVPTYYLGSTGYATSGGTNIATYTYTVPFQAYQFTPGHTNQVAVSPNLTQQVTSKLLTPGGAGVTLPTGWTITSNPTVASHTYGTIQEIGAVKELQSSENIQGFTTTAYNASSAFSSGSQSLSANGVPGVWYNYSTNATSSSLAGLNVPNSAGDPLYTGGTSYSTVTLNVSLGPTYVAWTSPAAGTININLNAWDVGQKSGDGEPAFFVMTSTGGPTHPLVSAYNTIPAQGNYYPFTSNMTATQGTLTAIVSLSGFTGSSGNGGSGYGLSWQSGNITVTSGEVLYFVADPGHTYHNGHSYSSYQGAQNPLSLNDVISFAPEPSSFVLMGLAGVGLALAAWRRRRSA